MYLEVAVPCVEDVGPIYVYHIARLRGGDVRGVAGHKLHQEVTPVAEAPHVGGVLRRTREARVIGVQVYEDIQVSVLLPSLDVKDGADQALAWAV